MPFRRWLYLLSGLLIGGTFLYITARNVDLGEVLAAIYGIKVIWLMPFVALWFLNVYFRSLRWQFMFPIDSRPSLRHAVDGYLIGRVSNNFMPGRLGELVRAGVIGRFYPDVGFSGALATIMVEKIFDSLAILSLLGLALLIAPLPSWINSAGASLIAVFSVLLLALWIIGRADSRSVFSTAAVSSVGAMAKARNFMFGLVKKFSTGLHTLKGVRNFTHTSVITFLIWGGEAIMMYSLIKAFSISAPFMAGVVSLVFLCIGGMLPAAPGFIGTYQLFIVAGMQIYSVPETSAFALSVFLNFFLIVMTTVLGALAIFFKGGMVNFRSVFASASDKA